MAEGTVTTLPSYVARLTTALLTRMPTASVSTEQVRRDRYRFIVVATEFEELDHPERQQLVWKVAEDAIEKADIWNVAMIITMAPSETR